MLTTLQIQPRGILTLYSSTPASWKEKIIKLALRKPAVATSTHVSTLLYSLLA